MHLFFKNYATKIALAMLLVYAGQFLSSCSKDKGGDQIDPANRTKLTIKVLGITDPNEVSSINAKASIANKSKSAPKSNKILNFKGFDAMVSLERDIIGKSKISLKSGANEGNGGPDLMAAAVDNGVKYRLLLYKKDGTFVSSTLLTSGTEGEIDVVKGDGYDWYAVSYNNAEDVPDVSSTNPNLVLPGGTDVLYASGEVDIPEGGDDINIPLSIVFQHKLAMVAIELNTMGMFADMTTGTALSVSGLAVKTGTLDLKTGTLSNLTDYVQTIDYDSFADVEPPYADRKVAYVYTADETPMNNLAVSVNNLSLILDNGNTRSFATVLSSTPSVFTFNVTPQLGSSYRALINLIESPLTLDGVQWARQNVYYNGGHNPYRFHHTYAPTDARNSYFSFKSATPYAYGANGDPCALVYPEGVWRQASNNDFTTLTGVLGIGAESITYGTQTLQGETVGYFEYQASTGLGAPYPSNNLHFNFNGSGINIGLVENIISIDLGNTFGTDADLWTSDAVLGIPGLGTGLGAWYYHGNRTIIGTNSQSMNAELLNVQVIGLDLVESSFKNVRCVRETND